MVTNRSEKIIIVLIITIGILIINNILALPSGATINITKNSSAYSGKGASNVSAFAGNITEINIDGTTNSQVWQGYYGNVTGGMYLANSEGYVFYNWSSIATSGEVYASRNESIVWTNIVCFNFTAIGNYSDDSENRGNTSLYGMNVTQLENMYNISPLDKDGIEETFNLRDHRLFFTNNLEFSEGECPNTRILNNSGEGIFEEILLYSPENKEVIFASIIMDNIIGFDGKTHDFEMMVLDDGHGSDTQVTDYYFYLELGS
ncbi:MAG: hypothetical protein QXW97_04125 [Candidatus Pacearchaeota archaeon]